MPFDPHTRRPVEELETKELKRIFVEPLEVSEHATDYLSDKKRLLFNPEVFIKECRREPNKLYRQANGAYRAYYRRENGYQEVIFEIKRNKTIIATFMVVKELPQVEL